MGAKASGRAGSGPRQTLLDLNVNGAVVSVIVERARARARERVRVCEVEVLLQTRWKPARDPVYSGTLEIPAGGGPPRGVGETPQSFVLYPSRYRRLHGFPKACTIRGARGHSDPLSYHV